LTHAIGVNEAGPATQTKVLLAGDANSSATIHCTIDGHEWINLSTFSPTTSNTQVVIDADGTLIRTFPNTRITDDVPADTCSITAYGYIPASTGGLSRPAGSSPVQIDPVAGHLFQLLGPQTDGTFTNLEQVMNYPFN
jgi:hypothetical protein